MPNLQPGKSPACKDQRGLRNRKDISPTASREVDPPFWQKRPELRKTPYLQHKPPFPRSTGQVSPTDFVPRRKSRSKGRWPGGLLLWPERFLSWYPRANAGHRRMRAFSRSPFREAYRVTGTYCTLNGITTAHRSAQPVRSYSLEEGSASVLRMHAHNPSLLLRTELLGGPGGSPAQSVLAQAKPSAPAPALIKRATFHSRVSMAAICPAASQET